MTAPSDTISAIDQQAAFLRADASASFGPSFFLRELGRFVRDRCPESDEHLPLVQLALADGHTLNVCHVIGVAPHWALIAVSDTGGDGPEMIVEFVPFEMIRRVSIRTRRAASNVVGFHQPHAPQVMTSETLLHAAIAHGAART